MYKNIIFYNHFHNGDLHVSREFVRKISSAVKSINNDVNISYCHKNDVNCLIDIPNVNFNTNLNCNYNESFAKGDTLYINTWYGQKNYHYMNSYGISFDCLYMIFDDVCKLHFNFSLHDLEPNPEKWFPKIDFSKYNIGSLKNFLHNNNNFKVFVANNKALSGQAYNFPMIRIINNLAKMYPKIIFILTNHEGELTLPNTMYSSSIINKNGFDLNENGFISTYCNVIIGRASGPHTFSFIQENLFERKNLNICFSNLTPLKENTFWLSSIFRDKIKYTSKIITNNTPSDVFAQDIIQKALDD